MKINLISFFLILCSFFFTSCKTKIVPQKSTPPIPKSADETLQSPLPTLKYHTFASKIKVDYSSPKEQISFNASLRILKDSTIWISLYGPFNIEGARCLMTPDSFKLMNKLNGEFTQKPLSALTDLIPIRISFKDLQGILVEGFMPTKTTHLILKDQRDSLRFLEERTPQYSYQIAQQAVNYTVLETMLIDLLLGQKMKINFEAMEQVGNYNFSMDRDLLITQSNEKTTIHLQYHKWRLDEAVEFPFEVPANYKILK